MWRRRKEAGRVASKRTREIGDSHGPLRSARVRASKSAPQPSCRPASPPIGRSLCSFVCRARGRFGVASLGVHQCAPFLAGSAALAFPCCVATVGLARLGGGCKPQGPLSRQSPSIQVLRRQNIPPDTEFTPPLGRLPRSLRYFVQARLKPVHRAKPLRPLPHLFPNLFCHFVGGLACLVSKKYLLMMLVTCVRLIARSSAAAREAVRQIGRVVHPRSLVHLWAQSTQSPRPAPHTPRMPAYPQRPWTRAGVYTSPVTL